MTKTFKLKMVRQIKWTSVTLSEIAVILFWILVTKDHPMTAYYTFVAAGGCACIALIAVILEHIICLKRREA